ncbi:phosphatidate cytidylyltransferase [Chitinibacter bivalviorum]|uniref:Phosphatidate cytidylyltransferase n=1 Tax=Chitinibacter bivalviorum TaxID=2739434 RepID=A0A7H9BI57_9NEIS|nr:phosphatidate cytidylyltransferase [Chitinibacter bivalviorum]QLG87888.1 phosphatidate cytidylyltransferase [Chitinibacter bivalviorum]
MLKTRIITACVLLPIILLDMFMLPPQYWVLFCAALLGFAAWEWQRLAAMNGSLAKLYPLIVPAVFLLLWYFLPLELRIGLIFASAIFWLLAVPFWLKKKWILANAGNLNALLGLLILTPAAMSMVILHPDGWTLLAVMMIAWIADTFAYFTGKAFGKRKLAPSISPGKSWEGVFGGTLAVVIYVQLLPKPFLLFSSVPALNSDAAQVVGWLIIALVLTAVSVMGDLIESLFKRQAGMKDSSSLLPGHGGVLDRIDSLLAILPVSAAIYLAQYI